MQFAGIGQRGIGIIGAWRALLALASTYGARRRKGLAQATYPQVDEENADGEVIGLDAHASSCTLAEQLRIGSLETKVYKGRGEFRRLSHLARGYGLVAVDVAWVKNRLKSVLRSRGVGYRAGRSVYAKRDRERWLGEFPEATRPLAEFLYEEHDALAALKARAEKALLAEARKHRSGGC